jgi:putative phosphoribosyl transferase
MSLGDRDRIFADRTDAGRELAKQLRGYRQRGDVVVLGVPRGGVVVAFEVASALHVPLDIFVSRKLCVPGREELAFGAIASGNVRVLDQEIVEGLEITEKQIEVVTEAARKELERRERLYRGGRSPLLLEGQTVLLVDDGIATGSSMLAAIRAVRFLKPARLVVAVPVAPQATCSRLRREVDELVCVETPRFFYAIGQFYDDFSQVSDEEVAELLRLAPQPALQNS